MHLAAASVIVAIVFFIARAQYPLTYREAIARASQSVVSIYARGVDGSEKSIGSGVVVSRRGHLITNFHLLSSTHALAVELHDGTTHRAQLVGVDPRVDLAFLQIPVDHLHPIALHTAPPMPGDIVFAIGSPYGLNRSASMGIISAVGRDHLGADGAEYFIQTDAAINPGSSGGPLVTAHAELIGINSAMFYQTRGGAHGIGFAIPADVVQASYQSLVLAAPSKQNAWGIALRPVSQPLLDLYNISTRASATRGTTAPALMVVRVWEHSPAAQVDLQIGDLLVSVNGAPAANFVVSGVLSSQAQTLVILRNGEEYQLTLPPVFTPTQ